ncbi:MAG: thiamine pyrophosphate-binding protein [Gemmatimonadales bacterium]
MTTAATSAADVIVGQLEGLGVPVCFGVPGSQNVWLFEALRRSRVRTVVGSDEMAAAFMAAAYARVTGGLAVLTTIPGPGFTFSLPGIAEARADSAALLYLATTVDRKSHPFTLQLLPQREIAAGIAKAVVVIESVAEIGPAIARAAALATSGEPGPVVVEIDSELLHQPAPAAAPQPLATGGAVPDLAAVVGRLAAARRPLFFLGQGARDAGRAIQQYATARTMPIVTTCSGRGIVPESDRLVLYRDFSFGLGPTLPKLIEQADLVVAVGCKFSHNGTAGFELPFHADRLIHIDRSPEVLAARYCGGTSVEADAAAFGAALNGVLGEAGPTDWSADELAVTRRTLDQERVTSLPFPPTVEQGPAIGELFAELDSALPASRIVTTDSGYHQGLVRSLARVHRPMGLLAPTDFQSMGFGLPAAIAAKVAEPDAVVVACIGDGGFAMMAGEILTARREGLDLIVVVFNNGALGLIENSQVRRFGHRAGTQLINPDFALAAAALGATYHLGNDGFGAALRTAAAAGGVHLIELALGARQGLAAAQARAVVRETAKRAMGSGLLGFLRRLRR